LWFSLATFFPGPTTAMSRLAWVGVFVGGSICVVTGPAAAEDAEKSRSRPPVVLTDEARKLHAECLLIDGHNDLPWQMRSEHDSSFTKCDIAELQPSNHTDIPRLRQGGLGAQFWAAYAPVETIRSGEATHVVLEQIDLIREMIRRYPDTFELALTADDIERIHGQGKVASLIGVEGGHAIEDSLGVLRMLSALGVRYMTLTHADTLSWADAATDDPRHGGLSPFGEEVVRRMNELGMLVDISHVSPDTMRDALAISSAPVIASHSSAFAIAPHPRNVPDDVLQLIKANGGVVMVNFFSGFVVPESAKTAANMFQVRRELAKQHPDPKELDKAMKLWEVAHPLAPGTIHDVVDHIDHIVRIAGVDHVGIGSDFDGVSKLPAQLEDVSAYPLITQELLNRGYEPEDIRKILGGNLLRALRGAEQTAREMHK
jgi:membrane dipeptidase